MFPEFFKNKAKEVVSFLHIVTGKILGDDETRKQGVDEALRAMEKEKQVYLKEKREASANIDSDHPFRNNKSRKKDSPRDISAI